MRIAALAFGILAGLVASLILALGGLGPEGIFGLERQASLVRFGLFVVGNLGIFGAALVLAAPLAGAIVLVVAAISWIAAAALLRHGFDFVMLTPPAILLVAIVLAAIAHVRRPLAPAPVDDEDPESIEDEPELPPPTRRFTYERAAAPRAVAPDFELEFEPQFEPEFEPDSEFEPDPVDAEIEPEPPPSTPVHAKFFGLAGTANPSRAAPVPATTRLRNLLPQTRKPSEDDWSPGRRRPPPPRQQSVFRELETEDEDDEASGFGRFALGLSNLLNFALYAALAAAALLLLINLRGFGETPAPAAAPLASSPAQAAAAAAPAAAPVPALSSLAPAAPVLVASVPAAVEPSAPPAFIAPDPEPEPTAAAEPLPSSEVPAPSSEAPPPEPPPEPAEAPAAAPTPYRMPPAMALARAQPAARAPAAAPPPPDTGL